ncbi:hypothetical protein [Flavisolibacter nicotianae]|uniref:hypothetical protein n=1 Tax=Flavisolibacter nicotianae TaxID=2364882 RepID=UPI000EB3EC3A|nr:hypothetical protein [Flavisolibacter nicotianae]
MKVNEKGPKKVKVDPKVDNIDAGHIGEVKSEKLKKFKASILTAVERYRGGRDNISGNLIDHVA